MQKSKSDIDRRRRRQRRLQIVIIYTAIAVGLAWFFELQATTTVIFVRHAEKALVPADNPGLSEAGKVRAAELARQLVAADVVAGVDAIYSTSYRHTEETVLPVATALNIPIRYYNVSNTKSIMDDIVKAHKGKIVLVVGHSNTVPEMIGNMGASKNVPEIDDSEYDNIYVVSIPWFGKTKTIRLRYGAPYVPD
ncbi:MAG: phosphoglycerate mutase family protein [Woeseiaceae bacterium]|nr:phosphoglycerate mutase family protein [Woeseiaceae bacterium]